MTLNQEEKWLLSEKHSGMETADFLVDLSRLRAGEPLAYIIGYTPFLDCRIYLDSRPLIPRPETEHWVEKAIQAIRDSGITSPRVLDLCAGSGCIGVAVTKAVPTAALDFVEIDTDHHETIRKNLASNGVVSDQIQIFGSNLFQNVTDAYDFILTNPPYIDPVLDRADSSVKMYEPHLALYGGRDGLEIINTIIYDSVKFLRENGQLWLEHEPEQVVAIHRCAEDMDFHVTTYTDQYGVQRYSVLTRF
jgi:release factor glutamine methyltransferase